MENNLTPLQTQQQIIETLKVKSNFVAEEECLARIKFLKKYLRSSQQKTYVLGISGGIDSTVAGRLAQLAVEELRSEKYPAHFIAIRLPYGVQLDAKDAEAALNFIKPDQILHINIKHASDQAMQAILDSHHTFASEEQKDFVLGNIKARQRMIIQYAIASSKRGLVIGTDHAAEALMGFFTKHGDGACDVAPLYGLNKRRILLMGHYLKTPTQLINKKPTADLENLSPLRLDEDVYGITYSQIDDFLEGKEVSDTVFDKILMAYSTSEHKRKLPVTPY